MGEPTGEDSDTRKPLDFSLELKRISVAEYPEVVEDARIERDPGDAPKNLRIFMTDGSFLDIWLSQEKYSYHWQSDDSVVRFDNAPHHDVETFPQHLHLDEEITDSPLRGDPEADVRHVLEFLSENWIE